MFGPRRGLVIAYRVLRRTNSSTEGDKQLPISAFDSRPRSGVGNPPTNAATTTPDDANTDEIEHTSPKDDTRSRKARNLIISDASGDYPKNFNSVSTATSHEGVNGGHSVDCAADIGASLRKHSPSHSADNMVTDGCKRGAMERTSAGSSANICSVSANVCDDKSPSQGPSVSSPLLMVVVPGLLQTLGTLETALMPLIEARHPSISVTVLIVAPPGLPNTHWPATATLDGKVSRADFLTCAYYAGAY